MLPRLSYANVMSSVAVFIALGGTGYALTIPRNSVGNKQLKNNAVSSGKIRARAVQRSDLAPAARVGSRGARGPSGPPGSQGATGPSETIQVRRPDESGIASAAGAEATLASFTLQPGIWALDAGTSLRYEHSSAPSVTFECRLQTAAGEVLIRSLVRAGNAAGSVIEGPISLRVATRLDVATQVRFVCRHADGAPGNPKFSGTTLQAMRTGALDDR